MRIETAMNYNQNDGLLKMIRRTDPMICVFATSLMSRGCKRSVDYFAPRRKVVAFFLGDAGTGTVSLSQEENMTVAGTAKLLLFTNEQGKTNNNCY